MELNTSADVSFGELLRQFRKRKRLNQTQLAERIGVSRETISLWERGEYKPETDTFLHEIVRILNLTEQEKQQLFEAYTVTALATSFHNPPLKRNPYFTGRSAQLHQLHKLLMAGKQVALTQAISGLGGIGKTQLALEYAYRYQKSYHDIFWANADTEESLMASYVQFADVLHLPEYTEADQNKVRKAVQYWLRKHTGWLLILDNMEDLHLLQQFVPIDRQGAVLLTTRRQVTEPVAQALELELLPENDAILFLLRRTKVLAVDMSLEDASVHDIEAARAITHLLGNLPLALDQAGAYILETPCSFAEYLALFQTYQEQLLQRRIGENIPTDHPASVTTTFRLNFQQVKLQSNAAAELLHLCAFLAPDAIPEEILRTDVSTPGPILASVTADAFLFNQAIEVLRAYSLVLRDPQAHTLSVHRLVQAVLRDSLPIEIQQQWVDRVIRMVTASLPGTEDEDSHWPVWERLFGQVQICIDHIRQGDLQGAEATCLLDLTGSYLVNRVRYREAETLLEKSLQMQEQQLKDDHPSTATCLNNLAKLYKAQGRHKQAEVLYQRVLAIREKQWGADHLQIAPILDHLASIYEDLKEYDQAIEHHVRAKTIREKQLGTDHLDTVLNYYRLSTYYLTAYNADYNDYGAALSQYLDEKIFAICDRLSEPDRLQTVTQLDTLAWIYRRYAFGVDKAAALYRRALAMREERLGKEHIDTAENLLNLAEIYEYGGEYEQARLLYERATSIYEQHLGEDHGRVALCINRLALLYQKQQKYEQAQPLFERAFAIFAQQFGSEDPITARILFNLAANYNYLNENDQAELLYQRVFAICESQVDINALTAQCLSALANFYKKQKKYKEAEQAFKRLLKVPAPLLKTLNLDEITVMNMLAMLYQDWGRYTQAEPLYVRVLAIYEQLWGEKTPDTADSLSNLATLYRNQGKYAQAQPLYVRALAIFEQLERSYSLDVTYPLHGLAEMYRRQGKYAQAEPLYLRELQIMEQLLRPEHPDVAYPLQGLGDLNREQGKYAEAESLYQHALSIRKEQFGSEHPLIAFPLHGQAELSQAQGKYAEAEQLFQRALHIREQQLGPEHPDVAYPLNNLALLYSSQGRYAEAEPLYLRALHVREKQLGPQHPETAETMHDIARFREAQGNGEEAGRWYARALAVRGQTLGVEHPKTTETRSRLITLLHTLGQHEKAGQLEAVQSEPEKGE